MSTEDAQKSEVHAATADAESSPTSAGDAAFTRPAGAAAPAPSFERNGIVAPVSHGPVKDVHIVDDLTDEGGPLVIESTDPDLNPPHVPIDPFPTERKPEIDPPAK